VNDILCGIMTFDHKTTEESIIFSDIKICMLDSLQLQLLTNTRPSFVLGPEMPPLLRPMLISAWLGLMYCILYRFEECRFTSDLVSTPAENIREGYPLS